MVAHAGGLWREDWGNRRGPHEAGYAEGKNGAIEYRWAETQVDRFRRWQPTWLVEGRGDRHDESACAMAAKAATTTVSVVFFPSVKTKSGILETQIFQNGE
jgi:hypothetical protein